MTSPSEGLYPGAVTHQRVGPISHRFRYSVFSMFADVDRLAEWDRKLKFFSVNRANLFSLWEGDFGDGGNLRPYLQTLADEALGAGHIQRFYMLCYPRVLGYAFNPLTVFYGLDRNGRVALTIYEVNNTFGERHTYVMEARPDASGVIRHGCDKQFHVSPFNPVSGHYTFRTRLPSSTAALGIRYEDEGRLVMTAQFAGDRLPVSDAVLTKLFARHMFMTRKIWLGIRWEALKLWVRGLKIFRKPPPPSVPIGGNIDHKSGSHEDLAA